MGLVLVTSVLMSFFRIKTYPPKTQRKPVMIVVGTRISKKASERNLIKRRIKAIIYPIIKKRLKSDYIITANPEIKNANFEEIKGELEKKITTNQ